MVVFQCESPNPLLLFIQKMQLNPVKNTSEITKNVHMEVKLFRGGLWN